MVLKSGAICERDQSLASRLVCEIPPTFITQYRRQATGPVVQVQPGWSLCEKYPISESGYYPEEGKLQVTYQTGNKVTRGVDEQRAVSGGRARAGKSINQTLCRTAFQTKLSGAEA